MNRNQAIELILKHFPEKTIEWAESNLSRAEANVDGAVEDFSEIVAGEFGIEPILSE